MTIHTDLIADLRALSRYGHSDSSIGDEAADALEALSAQMAAVRAQEAAEARGEFEPVLRDLLWAYASQPSCQSGAIARCRCVRCASDRARAILGAADPVGAPAGNTGPVSGLHVAGNLRPIPAPENLKKGNRFEPC